MEEVKHEIKTFHVDCTCPKCKEGRLRPYGNHKLKANDPRVKIYPHMCGACLFKTDVEGKQYPYTYTESVVVKTAKGK